DFHLFIFPSANIIERAKAPSPGQHPGLAIQQRKRPERAKASNIQSFCPFRANFYIHPNTQGVALG
uniref:hypothetical protein n=1 Tax=Segatella copri TaxID=165179 RepID=UPI004025080B